MKNEMKSLLINLQYKQLQVAQAGGDCMICNYRSAVGDAIEFELGKDVFCFSENDRVADTDEKLAKIDELISTIVDKK